MEPGGGSSLEGLVLRGLRLLGFLEGTVGKGGDLFARFGGWEHGACSSGRSGGGGGARWVGCV